MRTWKDIPELCDKERFSTLLAEEGSFAGIAQRVGCDRMSVRRAALAHGVRSPYQVVPKFLRGKGR